MQFFFNSFVYKLSSEILRALIIVINSVNEIIAFFYYPNTYFTSLFIKMIFTTRTQYLL